MRIGDVAGVAVEEPGTPDVGLHLPQEALVRMLAGVLPAWEAYLEGLLGVEPRMTESIRALLQVLSPAVPWYHPADDWW